MLRMVHAFRRENRSVIRLGLASALAVTAVTFASDISVAEPEPPDEESAELVASGSAFTPSVGQRFADTRVGGNTIDGLFEAAGTLAAGTEDEVTIAGRGSVPLGAVGVLANVTAVNPAAAGFFTVYDCDSPLPNVSALNYAAATTVANEVFVPLSAAGSICVYTSAASDVLVDIVGNIMPGDTVMLMDAKRYAESRAGATTFDGQSQGFGRTTPGSTTKIRIAGRGGVPSVINSAVVNVGVIDPTSNSFVTVHACLGTTPNASSMNHTIGVNRANELVVPVDMNGDICVYTDKDVDLVVDVAGYVESDSELRSMGSSRFADTRNGGTTVDGQNAGGGAVAAGSTTMVQVAGRASVPADAVAAVVNAAAIDPLASGFLTVTGCVSPMPNASSLNYSTGVNGSNELIVPLDPDGKLCVFSSASTDLILDVSGYLDPIDLQILAINDFHGNIATSSGSFGGTGRADFLATNIAAREADADNSIFVSAGDLIGASPLISALFHDEPTIEAMNLHRPRHQRRRQPRVRRGPGRAAPHGQRRQPSRRRRPRRRRLRRRRLRVPRGQRRGRRRPATRSSRRTRSATTRASRSPSSA